MATTNDLKARIDAFARELAAEMGGVDESQGDCWLDALENQAVELGDAICVELTRQLAQQRGAQAEANCPQCGKPGRFQGKRERQLIGRRGPVLLTEPEYFCPCCRKAFFPSDPSDRG